MPTDTGNPAHADRYQAKKEKERQQQQQAASKPKIDETGFWANFAEKWKEAEENIRLNDEFMKQQLDPAFNTYQQRLSGLSQEPGFSPIGIKMGDFSTSFMPQRGRQNAQDILKSQMAQAELMQPRSAEMSYLDRLKEIGMFDREIDVRKWMAKKQKQWQDKGDSGTFLDAATDIIGLGTSGTKLWNMWGV